MRSLMFGVVLSCSVACRSGAAPTAASAIPPADLTTFRATGTVVEFGGGPVANAAVSAVSCEPSPRYGNVYTQTQTDTSGGFSLAASSGSPLPIGCVFLRIRKDGYVWSEQPTQGSADGLTIRIQRLREVSGRVVEVDGGPVSGVKVSGGGVGSLALSGADGSFVVASVGDYFTLAKDGFVARSVAAPSGQDVAMGTVNIQRAIGVSGASLIASQISSDDVAYELGDLWGGPPDWCSPCKWIDLQTGQDLDVQLDWTGATPLQLWAAASNGPGITATPKRGASTITLRVPASTRILLVGVPGATSDPKTLQPRETFELKTILP